MSICIGHAGDENISDMFNTTWCALTLISKAKHKTNKCLNFSEEQLIYNDSSSLSYFN